MRQNGLSDGKNLHEKSQVKNGKRRYGNEIVNLWKMKRHDTLVIEKIVVVTARNAPHLRK